LTHATRSPSPAGRSPEAIIIVVPFALAPDCYKDVALGSSESGLSSRDVDGNDRAGPRSWSERPQQARRGAEQPSTARGYQRVERSLPGAPPAPCAAVSTSAHVARARASLRPPAHSATHHRHRCMPHATDFRLRSPAACGAANNCLTQTLLEVRGDAPAFWDNESRYGHRTSKRSDAYRFTPPSSSAHLRRCQPLQ